jgi:hypothetical protein
MDSLFLEEELKYDKNSLKLILAGIMVIINVSYAILLFLVVYPKGLLNNIELVTRGIISITFIAYIPLNVLNVLFFLLIAKMSFSEMGLSWNNLWQGLVIIAGLWLLSELTILFIDLGLGVRPLISDYWSTENVGPITLGFFIKELLGNSLFEEVLYRGILIPQLFVFFKKREFFKKDILSWIISILISQILFALMHLPSRIYAYDYTATEIVLNLLLIFAISIILAIIFLFTKNLVVTIGFHAIININLPLFTHFDFSRYIFTGLVLIFSITYFIIRHKKQQKESTDDFTSLEEPKQKEEINHSLKTTFEENGDSSTDDSTNQQIF